MHQTPLPHTHTGLVEDFVNHLKTGAPIRCSGELGLQTNADYRADNVGTPPAPCRCASFTLWFRFAENMVKPTINYTLARLGNLASE